MRLFGTRSSHRPAASPWPNRPPALRRLDWPDRLRIPLFTEPGAAPPRTLAPDSPVVKGQSLALDPSTKAPTPMAPTSGRVVGPGRATLLDGRPVQTIDLAPDRADRSPPEPHDADHAAAHQRLAAARQTLGPDDLDDWIARFCAAGIHADRITCPDLIVQLQRLRSQPVDVLLCNLLEADSMLPLSSLLSARLEVELLAGVSILARLGGVEKTWLVNEATLPRRWSRPIRRAANSSEFQLVPLRNHYPRAHPTLMLHGLLGRQLAPGRRPVERGVLMVDAAAAIAVGRYVTRDQPMLQTPLAVFDHVGGKAHYVIAPIGMTLADALRQIGVGPEGTILRAGEMLRDIRTSADAVVAGNELSVHVAPVEPPINPEACIRCSWCVQACPTRIQPAGLLEASQRDDPDLAEHYGLHACIECGVCAYVCPSHLPLMEGIRKLKRSAAPAPADRANPKAG